MDPQDQTLGGHKLGNRGFLGDTGLGTTGDQLMFDSPQQTHWRTATLESMGSHQNLYMQDQTMGNYVLDNHRLGDCIISRVGRPHTGRPQTGRPHIGCAMHVDQLAQTLRAYRTHVGRPDIGRPQATQLCLCPPEQTVCRRIRPCPSHLVVFKPCPSYLVV